MLNSKDLAEQVVNDMGTSVRWAENNSAKSYIKIGSFTRLDGYYESSGMQSLNDSTEMKMTGRQLEAIVKIPNGSMTQCKMNANSISRPRAYLIDNQNQQNSPQAQPGSYNITPQ